MTPEEFRRRQAEAQQRAYTRAGRSNPYASYAATFREAAMRAQRRQNEAVRHAFEECFTTNIVGITEEDIAWGFVVTGDKRIDLLPGQWR